MPESGPVGRRAGLPPARPRRGRKNMATARRFPGSLRCLAVPPRPWSGENAQAHTGRSASARILRVFSGPRAPQVLPMNPVAPPAEPTVSTSPAPAARHIRLTSHPVQGPSGAPVVKWGAADPLARGPIVGTTTPRRHPDVIGPQHGSYGVSSLIHISEPTRLWRNSYAVFCLKKKKKKQRIGHADIY